MNVSAAREVYEGVDGTACCLDSAAERVLVRGRTLRSFSLAAPGSVPSASSRAPERAMRVKSPESASSCPGWRADAARRRCRAGGSCLDGK